jgi:micrococcal nuclease
MYEYQAHLVHVVDGDTIHAEVDLGCDVHIYLTLRFAGLNAPEKNTPEGVAAIEFLNRWFEEHCPQETFTLHTVKDRREKYGRYLATIVAPDGAVVNKDLLDSGNAVAYDGGKR